MSRDEIAAVADAMLQARGRPDEAPRPITVDRVRRLAWTLWMSLGHDAADWEQMPEADRQKYRDAVSILLRHLEDWIPGPIPVPAKEPPP